MKYCIGFFLVLINYMANPHEKMAAISPPDHETDDDYYDGDDELVPSSSCGCFWGLYARVLPCGRNSNSGITRRYLLQQGEVARENWLVENVKKVREFSEVLAGPKWKNFIRSIGSIYKKRRVQAQYDPHSYALNFDEGVGREEDNSAYLHFSSTGYPALSLGMNKGKTGQATNGF